MINNINNINNLSLSSKIEVFEFLNENKSSINNSGGHKLHQYVIPTFMAAKNSPRLMMDLIQWFELNTNKEFIPLVVFHFDKLENKKLSVLQFAILCGVRGSFSEPFLSSEIMKKSNNESIQKIAKHKDFPIDLKQKFYTLTDDVDYLPKDAIDVFVF